MGQKSMISRKKLKQSAVTYSFVLPDFIGLLIFIIIPIVYSLYMSLYNWNFANVKEFIGLQNYITMFHDMAWWNSLMRTFKLTLLYVPALFSFSILFAVLIDRIRSKKTAGFVKTAFLLPYSITSVIASCLWMFLYMDRTGFINIFLKTINIENQKFLGSTTQAMACIAVVLLWINMGYNIILFLSAIKDIPESYYEAAKLDYILENYISVIKTDKYICTYYICDSIVPMPRLNYGYDGGRTCKIYRSSQSLYL